MFKQRTLKTSATISGVGVHSGANMQLALYPADVNTGIVFRRIDLQPTVTIPALHQYVGDTRLNTCLAKDGAMIATVEHLLSAFAGLGIDNAYVEIMATGSPIAELPIVELPVLDGSAFPFVSLIREAGVVEQAVDKLFLKIKREVSVTEGDKIAKIEPYDGFKFSLAIDFNHPAIMNSRQEMHFDFTQISYIEEISHARTFGFLSEYEYLRSNNLALGAGLENTVVLNDTAVVNVEGLRYPDEFIKHKVLDAVGDLHLLGHNFIGAFTGHKSGHSLNHRLREALLADKDAWELAPRPATDSFPVSFHLL